MEQMLPEEEMERSDLEDLASEVGKLSPVEYARMRGIRPQLVYYHIRQGHIEKEWCVCGRRVIDVALADETLSSNQEVSRRSGRSAANDAERTNLLQE
jgi:hypothetical protein